MDSYRDGLTDTEPYANVQLYANAQPFACRNEQSNAYAQPVCHSEAERNSEPDTISHAAIDVYTGNHCTDTKPSRHIYQHPHARPGVAEPRRRMGVHGGE